MAVCFPISQQQSFNFFCFQRLCASDGIHVFLFCSVYSLDALIQNLGCVATKNKTRAFRGIACEKLAHTGIKGTHSFHVHAPHKDAENKKSKKTAVGISENIPPSGEQSQKRDERPTLQGFQFSMSKLRHYSLSKLQRPCHYPRSIEQDS